MESAVIEKLVYTAVSIKTRIVGRDEREGGERRLLNLGHTFGHALESTTGIAHGEAVSVGMVLASELSVQKELLDRRQADRIKALLRHLGLPVNITFDRKAVLDALKKDKKRIGDHIHFVLLKNLGQAIVESISIYKLERMLNLWSLPLEQADPGYRRAVYSFFQVCAVFFPLAFFSFPNPACAFHIDNWVLPYVILSLNVNER